MQLFKLLLLLLFHTMTAAAAVWLLVSPKYTIEPSAPILLIPLLSILVMLTIIRIVRPNVFQTVVKISRFPLAAAYGPLLFSILKAERTQLDWVINYRWCAVRRSWSQPELQAWVDWFHKENPTLRTPPPVDTQALIDSSNGFMGSFQTEYSELVRTLPPPPPVPPLPTATPQIVEIPQTYLDTLQSAVTMENAGKVLLCATAAVLLFFAFRGMMGGGSTPPPPPRPPTIEFPIPPELAVAEEAVKKWIETRCRDHDIPDKDLTDLAGDIMQSGRVTISTETSPRLALLAYFAFEDLYTKLWMVESQGGAPDSQWRIASLDNRINAAERFLKDEVTPSVRRNSEDIVRTADVRVFQSRFYASLAKTLFPIINGSAIGLTASAILHLGGPRRFLERFSELNARISRLESAALGQAIPPTLPPMRDISTFRPFTILFANEPPSPRTHVEEDDPKSEPICPPIIQPEGGDHPLAGLPADPLTPSSVDAALAETPFRRAQRESRAALVKAVKGRVKPLTA